MTDFKKQLILIAGLSLLVFLARLLPHGANFSPVLALFLLAGRWGRENGFLSLLPLLALIGSDFVLGTYSGFLFVHLPLLLLFVIGRFWGEGWTSTFALGFGGSALFYLVSNFGVWWVQEIPLYSADLKGLLLCYEMALPFFRATLVSTLAWMGLFQIMGALTQASRLADRRG